VNFVQLVQRLRRKCRVTGTGATPITVVNQNEEYSRLINWTNEAWMDIQTARENWEWMRKSCSFTTVSGKPVYTVSEIGVTDFGNWTRDTWRVYDTSVGTNSEVFMDYSDYGIWRDVYQYGANRNTTSKPTVITITPAKSIGLGPVPGTGYTITGDYYSVPSEMVVDGDIPALPVQYHMMIVYRAMQFYGVSEAASEVYQEGVAEFDRMMRRLMLNQMYETEAGPALA
jgi:hypothetical protein